MKYMNIFFSWIKNKGPRIGGLDVKCIKYVDDIIRQCLCILFNESLLKSVYLNDFKTAKFVGRRTTHARELLKELAYVNVYHMLCVPHVMCLRRGARASRARRDT